MSCPAACQKVSLKLYFTFRARFASGFLFEYLWGVWEVENILEIFGHIWKILLFEFDFGIYLFPLKTTR